eukprot:scaffold15315_cov30-Tisochrysis_lutea.AAC.1
MTGSGRGADDRRQATGDRSDRGRLQPLASHLSPPTSRLPPLASRPPSPARGSRGSWWRGGHCFV